MFSMPKEILYQKYIIEKKTLEEISTEFNVNRNTLRERLILLNLLIPDRTEESIKRDSEILELYNKNTSIYNIGKIYNIKRSIVKQSLAISGIDIEYLDDSLKKGDVFSKLTIVKFIGYNKNNKEEYLCLCSCRK